MNAAAPDPARTALAVGYFVIWSIVGIGGWFYVTTRPTVELRRQGWKRYVIGFAAIVYAMMVVMLAINPHSTRRAVEIASVCLAPFFALIARQVYKAGLKLGWNQRGR